MHKSLVRVLLAVSLALGILTNPAPAAGYEPAPENLAAREWFQDARFGLFIHWGVYSLLGRGEWVMHMEDIPVDEYEKLPVRFNPVNYDPDAWCRMAKDAGMKYITITSKHHDGFAMFDSKVSDYDIVERTPYGKDVIAALAEACRRNGLKLFFYHSQLDWHSPDYWPRGNSSYPHGRPDSGDWNAYLDYMDGQLTELLTGYGEIGGIWFDGMWDKPDDGWRLEQTYGLIHRLQPAAMVGSNHHVAPFPGEDFQMFEKGLPGQDPFNKGSGISALPLEMCQTIGHSWGYDQRDKSTKSLRELAQTLVRAAGYGANLLLNVGPMPDGTIQADHVARLKQLGEWLKGKEESIYGTRRGPVTPRSWGVTTASRDGRKLYVHVLDLDTKAVALEATGGKPVAAHLLDGRPVEFAATKLGAIIRLPDERPDSLDTIVVLELK